jgi:hypothetical protein
MFKEINTFIKRQQAYYKNWMKLIKILKYNNIYIYIYSSLGLLIQILIKLLFQIIIVNNFYNPNKITNHKRGNAWDNNSMSMQFLSD